MTSPPPVQPPVPSARVQQTTVTNTYQTSLSALLALFGATSAESFVSLEVQGQTVILETAGMPSA